MDSNSEKKSLENYMREFSENTSWREIFPLLGITQGTRHRLLNIGAGFAWLEALSAHEFPKCEFIAIDSNLPRLSASKRALKHPNVHFIQGDAESLPIRAESLDSALIFNAFEHFSNPETVLEQCFAVLRPGGNVFLTAPNKFGRGHAHSEHFGAAREFTYFGLKRMFSRAGFESMFLPPKIPKTKGRINQLAFGLFASSGIWKLLKPGAFRIVLTKKG